jgi:patatin-like phospholipase/acyl hydrolase
MEWTRDRPFQALALTGGGYRGLFTATVLQTIEDHIRGALGKHFDLICGTSIGGIIALALAFEIPMERVAKVFDECGALIFPPHNPPASKFAKYRDLYRFANKPRYSAKPLRDAIAALIPADAVLGDATHPVAIPAVNLTEGKPQIFKTRHIAGWDRDSQFSVIDIALATAAAPTFFELAEVGGAWYADGGLFANAPDLVALHEAEHFFDVPSECVRLLSVGTTTKSYSVSFGAGRQFGIGDWMEDQRLFSVMISAQQQFVEQIVAHRLKERYLRIDKEPSDEQTNDLGLDVATPIAKQTLVALARKAATDQFGGPLETYLKHAPQLKPIKDA